ncbi:MAG: hypothetical protein IPO21_12060 [Bacteroidales bacterium]|nr:hypothetical protein [Bacteroidales bacterium]
MKIRLIFIVVLGIFVSNVSAQNCGGFFLKEKGKQITYQHFNNKNKLESISILTLKEIATTSTKVEYHFETRLQDSKGKDNGTFNYSSWCEGDNYFIDMSKFMGSTDFSAMGEISIETDNLSFPSKLSVGETLKDASLKIVLSGPISLSINNVITDRKVEAQETVVTPVGEFKCYKISSKSTSENMGMKIVMKSIEWYSENLGCIKSETYNSNGELESSQIVSAIK